MINLNNIFNAFQTKGELVSYKSFGSGHINNTYVSIRDDNGQELKYTHQRINKNVFKNPTEVMENIYNATNHLNNEIIKEGLADISRRRLEVILTNDNNLTYIDEEGNYWRTYSFIDNVCTYEILDNEDLAFKVGAAVGKFQKYLSTYKGERFHDTIPNFHNMNYRYDQFDTALEKDLVGRSKLVQKEIEFFLKNRKRVSVLTESLIAGTINEVITHNDTKLNNILFDEKSGEAICIIDLDTIMMGSFLFDTGDLIRTSTNTANEDERDLSKVNFNFEMFKPLIKGYYSVAKDVLNDKEKSLIAESGRVFASIMGLRFLTDYINGDTYYKIAYEDHNLVRARNQIKLMESMDSIWNEVQDFVNNL